MIKRIQCELHTVYSRLVDLELIVRLQGRLPFLFVLIIVLLTHQALSPQEKNANGHQLQPN